MAKKTEARKTIIQTKRIKPHATADDPSTLLIYLDNMEREELRNALNSRIFQKALDVINQQKPGVFPTNGFGGTTEQQLKNESNRIYEQRGWELYHANLVTVADDPIAQTQNKSDMPEATYPDLDEETQE